MLRFRRKFALIITMSLMLMIAPFASPTASADPTVPPVEKTIAEIQGEGDATPFAGQKVITTGVVTAAYPKGGFNGFYMETPGTADDNHSEKASDGIFVYVGKKGLKNMPAIGKCVKVTGTAGEYHGLTQISSEKIDLKSDCKPVKALTLKNWPTNDADREKLEGMLVLPQGDYTITNNYQLIKYGSIDLVQGDQPLAQATDVVAPGQEAQAYEAKNKQKLVTLDDGSSFSFDIAKHPKAGNNPLPWITKNHTARAGAHVTFAKPVIVDYRFQWNFQPTSQQVGIENMPVTIQQNRPAAPAPVGGDIKVGTFNVLNYFTDLGENEPNCGAYKDREGNPITAKDCQVRGAYRQADFERQQAKIVNAINSLGADVVSLEEIENPHTANGTPDLTHRDVPLSKLVEALNAKAGAGTWNYVKSPKEVPNNGDAIRVAFIYKPAKVKPVGESKILDNKYFIGVARSPLAQEFTPVVDTAKGEKATSFTLIVNHFKSKGSVANFPGIKNADSGDGQGNNNLLRVEQAKALVDFAKTFNGPVMLLGDFNAYSKEDPITTLVKAGYADMEAKFPHSPAQYSYQYGGRMGSLDHVLANEAASKLVTGVSVWEINAQEPIAYEYSRYNYNKTLLWDDSPYRSSDHNPALVGLHVIEKKVEPLPNPKPEPQPEVFYLLPDGSHASSLEAYVGDQVTVELTGLVPNEDVEFYLHSKPVYLGKSKSDAKGKVVFSFKIPQGTAIGKHTVIAKQLGKEFKLSLTVKAKAASPVASTHKQMLAKTGVNDLNVLFSLALLGLLGGAGLIQIRKVRH